MQRLSIVLLLFALLVSVTLVSARRWRPRREYHPELFRESIVVPSNPVRERPIFRPGRVIRMPTVIREGPVCERPIFRPGRVIRRDVDIRERPFFRAIEPRRARHITKHEARRLVLKAIAEVQQPEPIDTCSFWGDPHFTGYKGQTYSIFPEGDALTFAEGSYAIATRHHHWGPPGTAPTVATSIAVRLSMSEVVEYDAPLKQFRANGNIFQIAVGETRYFSSGSIKRTSTLAFEIDHKTHGKVTVTDSGGSMPWLTVVIQVPRSISSVAVPSLCGNYNGDYGRIIKTSIFTTPYDVDEVHYNVAITADELAKQNAYKSCSVLNGNAFDTCVFDYTHTPAQHRDELVKHTIKAHRHRARVFLLIAKRIEEVKRVYERDVSFVVRRLTRNFSRSVRDHCHEHVRRFIERVHRRVHFKIQKSGLRSHDRRLSRFINNARRIATRRIKKLKIVFRRKGHQRKAEKLVANAVKNIPQPEAIDTCSWWGDPHFTSWQGQTYSLFPIGDAVVVAEKNGPFAVHARHFPWSGIPTVAVAIAIRVHESEVIEYDAALKQYRRNGRIINAVVNKVVDLGKGATFTRTSELAFEVVAYNKAKTSVTDSGGATPWLTVVINTPRSVTKRLGKGTCGSYTPGNNVIVKAHGVFTTPYYPDEVHYNVPVTPDELAKQNAYKSCSVLNGHAFDTCVYDYTHTPAQHRDEFVKHTIKAHEHRAKVVQEVVKQFEEVKKVFEKKVFEVVERIVKKYPHLKEQCHKHAREHIAKVHEKAQIKHHVIGIKKHDKKIKKLIGVEKKGRIHRHKRAHVHESHHRPARRAPRVVTRFVVKKVYVEKKCDALRAKYNELLQQLSKLKNRKHRKLPKPVEIIIKKVERRVPKRHREEVKKTFRRLHYALRKTKKVLMKGGHGKAHKAHKCLAKVTDKVRHILKKLNKRARKHVKRAVHRLIKKYRLHEKEHAKCSKVRHLLRKVPKRYRKVAKKHIKRLLKKYKSHKKAKKHIKKILKQLRKAGSRKCKY